MSGRRSHARFAVVPSAEGLLSVLRDVIVQRVDKGEVIAISREPGVVGEAILVEVPTAPTSERVYARIVESRPLIVDGNVRHRLQLQAIVDATAGAAHVLQEAERR
jgi:hypothetical protein